MEIFDGWVGCPGPGKVDDDFPPGQQRTGPSRDHIQGPEIGCRDDAAHLYVRPLQIGIDPDRHLQTVIRNLTAC